MTFKPLKRIPVLIALSVIVLVCAVRVARVDFIERLERMTYDMRVREAFKFSPSVSTNLGFVLIDESSIDFVRTNTTLGYKRGSIGRVTFMAGWQTSWHAREAAVVASIFFLESYARIIRQSKWPMAE